MKITFVHYGLTENLGEAFLSSTLKRNGHEVEIIMDPSLYADINFNFPFLGGYFSKKFNLIDKVLQTSPDLVAFSVYTNNYQWSLDKARQLKAKKNIPVIFGGVHPTLSPQTVIENDCVDMICIGEGEGALLELADNWKERNTKRDIKNIWFKDSREIIKNPLRPLNQDLDSFPFPDKSSFYEKLPPFIYPRLYLIMTSRGCPFSCTYCSNNAFNELYKNEAKVRRRSVENVIGELKTAKEKFKIKRVSIADDVFTSSKDWLEKFALRYKTEINLPFSCNAHVQMIDEQRVKLLKETGCYRVTIGVQSASERTRLEILKRHEKNSQIIDFAGWCRKYKLPFTADHIFNIPFEGEEEQVEALKLYRRVRPMSIGCFWLAYYPNTEITKIAKEAGLLTDLDLRKIAEGQAPTAYLLGLGLDNPDKKFYNFGFIFSLLPLLPNWAVKRIIKKKMYKFRFSPPAIMQFLAKFLVKFKTREVVDTLYAPVVTFYFTYKILCGKNESNSR